MKKLSGNLTVHSCITGRGGSIGIVADTSGSRLDQYQ